jgi:glutathione S-transferase
MLELYHLPASICSQKVRLALFEKGLDWTGHVVDLGRFEHLEPAYLALNPNGVVPTLVHDGQPVTESTVICEYLDEVFAGPPLSPPDALGRARMRAWLRFIDEVPSMAVRVPSFNRFILPARKPVPEDVFAERLSRMTVRRGFFRRMGQGGFPPEAVRDAEDELALTLERIAGALGETGGPFLMGGRLTAADLCLAPVINRMDDLGMLGAGPARDWLDGLRARPSWALAFAEGSALKAG